MEDEARVLYSKDIASKGVILAVSFLRGIDIRKRQLTKNGLVCASCYLIAERLYKDGFWLGPLLKIKWIRFFHIDAKTFHSRISELETFNTRYRSISSTNVLRNREN